MRIHAYKAQDIDDASMFLVNGLLISHGIRRDTTAIVELSGRWIIAPGSRIRHLRPDQGTRTGWIKHVLRKGGGLGAAVTTTRPRELGEELVCVGPGGSVSLEDALAGCRSSCRVAYNWPWPGDCVITADPGMSVEPYMLPALVNIILDRIWAGLPPY